MGKSPVSCFKIIGCGGGGGAGDTVDHGDLQSPESKGLIDRSKWSFRKRSARHRILSNNVGLEASPSANKEHLESPAVSFQVQSDLTVPEKTSVIQYTEEKTEFPAQLESKLSDTLSAREDECKEEEKTEFPAQLESKLSDNLSAREDACKADETDDEPSIIIIQTGIRRLLAEQVLLKQKNIIKLQAAVRGHIVRRQAVGTLRCVQSIIKMQALVRARRVGQLGQVSCDSLKQSEICEKDNNNPMLLGKKEAKSNAIYAYVSIDKLLSNAFARQLMDSTPRTKPINIKCDPAKSDTAWKWLERWMSVSSVSSEGPQESGATEEHYKENFVHSDGEEDILVLSDCYADSPDSTSGMDAPLEEVLSTLPDSEVTESAPNKKKEAECIDVAQVASVPEMAEVGNNPDSEQAETEEKKLSRKASNPAFIAAQSKFEELSLDPTSTKLTSSGLDLGVKSGLDRVSSDTSAVQIGSECGTELSISSTLDSPDRSVIGIEHEMKVVSDAPEGQPRGGEMFEGEAIEKSPTLEADLSFTNTNDSKRYESSVKSDIVEPLNSISINDVDSHVEKRQEANPSGQQMDLESEASPRSHITVSESQTTPSSQVSIKPKKIKSQKSQHNRKEKSSLADKNRNQDSSSRSSLEQLPEHKYGKRRNSFGSSKPEHGPRESSSSSSLPSYMQATESAKAKALLVANSSPRSSPDVHDKDVYIKKRHSLPGNNERQGSPRIQRSLSQAQQNAKGNATNSPQDRKWRR